MKEDVITSHYQCRQLLVHIPQLTEVIVSQRSLSILSLAAQCTMNDEILSAWMHNINRYNVMILRLAESILRVTERNSMIKLIRFQLDGPHSETHAKLEKAWIPQRVQHFNYAPMRGTNRAWRNPEKLALKTAAIFQMFQTQAATVVFIIARVTVD